MNVRHILFAGLLCVPVDAQEVQRDVVPGREFHDSKVLTPGQTDLWTVDGAADEVLICRVTAHDLDPVLDLVDAEGKVMGRDDGAGSQSRVQIRLPAAGRVQFRVRGFQGAGGGRYELSLERYRTAPLELGGEASGEFPRERWHHVRLQLGVGERFVPLVDGGRLTAVVQFASGQRLGDNLGAFTAPEAGEYHLRLEGDERQHFRLRTLRPTVRDAAAGAPMGANVPPGGLEIVRLHLPGGAASLLDLGQWGPLQVWHRLLGEDPQWRELGSAQKGGRSRRLFLPARDLDLELWLRNPEAVPAPYDFHHAVLDTPLADDGATGATLPLCGLGCHTFQAVEGAVVSVRVAAPAFDAGMVVVAPNGETLATIADRSPKETDPEFTFCVPFPGTWRIVAFCESHTGSGAYRVEVTRQPSPLLGFDRPLSLDASPGHDGYAKLLLQAGQEVWLSARSRTCDVALSIDDDHGPRLGTWEGGGVDGNVLCAIRAPHAGVFTLIVHARSGGGACELSARAVE